MQTFLPFSSFERSAQCLDNRRLGKQRVEAYQIVRALRSGPISLDGRKTPWYNHPAVRMWKGYENALIGYCLVICDEWSRRGFRDTIHDKIQTYYESDEISIAPPWIGRFEFHRSHRSNLLRKDFDHYSKFFNERSDLKYVWPV